MIKSISELIWSRKNQRVRVFFANEYIRPKYTNIFEYLIICPILFWTILAIFIFCGFLGKYQTILDQK